MFKKCVPVVVAMAVLAAGGTSRVMAQDVNKIADENAKAAIVAINGRLDKIDKTLENLPNRLSQAAPQSAATPQPQKGATDSERLLALELKLAVLERRLDSLDSDVKEVRRSTSRSRLFDDFGCFSPFSLSRSALSSYYGYPGWGYPTQFQWVNPGRAITTPCSP